MNAHRVPFGKAALVSVATFGLLFFAAGCGKGSDPNPREETNRSDQAAASEPVAKTQTECPVMGGAIDKNLYVDYEGKRVYFCCGGCVEAFQKDPAKYLKVLADQGVTPEATPAPAVN